MGLFGGGGGGDISGGVNAVTQGTQQGLAALQQYYTGGVGALNTGAQQAQGFLAPYGVAGSTALDELYDTLGMARPTAGSQALSSALRNEDMLKTAKEGGTRQAGWLDPATFNFDDPRDAGGFMYQQGGDLTSHNQDQYAFSPDSGHVVNNWMLNSPTEDRASQLGLKAVMNPTTGKYELKSLAQEARALTPEEQAQYDLIQQYKGGTLGMTNPADMQAGVLAKLQATPGYQFLMNEGLQSIDRSAAARGLAGSGAAVKGATRYASGLAEQTYNNRIQQLSGAAGLGAQSTGQQAQTAGALGSALATLGSNMGSNTASLYGSQGSNLASLYGAQAQADASSSSSLFGLAGSALGMFKFSDRKLKKNIIPTGEFVHDILPIYEFSYIWDKDERHIGVMAQDVLQVFPEAVSLSEDGYMKVDYSRLA